MTQVLTDAESYEETSCTAMFIYGFAKGIRHGWLPSPEPYTAAVQLAWQGLTNHSVDELGNVHGVCRGSNFSYSEAYYKHDLLWVENDTHGTGIVMLAGDEVRKMFDLLAKDTFISPISERQRLTQSV
ncbi:glycoside hydrolase family 88 protein [Paenibacillus sp. MAH-36]|uniref:Glycoside hydrolase family 88 protein n=1 Tax=Paenibacillus violae TaxID=3077234 RepID=A0ABU3RMX7_9BACL|nr:glycoside hydrolase family 88 protein [Paenibacillus sp. PFR10]MDU0205359.1 glycoside hydrolase family 88 protein [Paenibacillus sp. PFR10]